VSLLHRTSVGSVALAYHPWWYQFPEFTSCGNCICHVYHTETHDLPVSSYSSRLITRRNPRCLVSRMWECRWVRKICTISVCTVTDPKKCGLDKVKSLEPAHSQRIRNQGQTRNISTFHMFYFESVQWLGYELDDRGILWRTGRSFPTLPKRPDPLWSQFYSICTARSFPKGKAAGAWSWPDTSI
jgi:hypothetical protein